MSLRLLDRLVAALLAVGMAAISLVMLAQVLMRLETIGEQTFIP